MRQYIGLNRPPNFAIPLQFSLLNPEVVLTRVGVFEEHLPVLESALNDFMNRQLPGVTRKDVKVADPRKKSADGESQDSCAYEGKDLMMNNMYLKYDTEHGSAGDRKIF